MVLLLEVFVPDKNYWTVVNQLEPGERRIPLSDMKPDGSKDTYIIECLTDTRARITKAKGGVDLTIFGTLRRDFSTEGLELVKELKRGDAPYTMHIKTDRSIEADVRFMVR